MTKNKIITKRLTAYILDVFLVYLLIYLISCIRFINPTYDKLIEVTNDYNVAIESYNTGEITDDEYFEINKDYIYNATKYNISTNIVFILVVIAYYGLFQKYNGGQTLGKKIMKIRTVNLDEESPSFVKYLLRIIPMYYVLLGSVVPFIISSILVFIVNSSSFSIIYSSLVYLFIIISIVSFVMMVIRKDKRGLHDLIAGTKVIEE